MEGITCPECGGNMDEIIGGDGFQCDTCGFIVRSDGTKDYSEMDEEDG